MAYKFVILSALLAVANAGYIGAPAAVAYAPAPYASHAIGSQTQSVYRSPDGNHAVSTYTKAVDSAYSSVRKYDTRVSNDAVYAAPAVAYSAPYAAPIARVAAPVAYAAPVAKVAAPLAYAPRVAAAPYAAPYAAPVAHAGLLGVAYSAAPAVAHISYSNGYGINYAY